MAVAYALDPVFEDHRPPGPHPERPERLRAVTSALRDAGLAARGLQIPVRAAAMDELARVHGSDYLAELEAVMPGRSGWLDADTYYSEASWEAARKAAGAAIDLSARVLAGERQVGLALVRPPGHHAEASRAMGFCILNNVAAAAAAARAAGCARVAIVDWDVHHGNGSQAIFWRDPAVLYASVHQFPHYPGTGAASEVGEGEGQGATVNVPLPAGSGEADWLHAFDQVVVPALDRFRPELILVSAGFDAHRSDPLADMRLDDATYRRMADRLLAVAGRHAGGRLVAVLEGGYDLAGLAGSATALLAALEGAPAEAGPPAEPSSSVRQQVAASRALHGLETW